MTSSKPTKVGSFHSQEKEKKMAQTKFKMLINCIHKESDDFAKAREENKIKDKIAKLLHSEGYKFVIVDEEYIKC